MKNKEKKIGKINQIIELHKQGKTIKEIIELGFNKTTVYINIKKHEKSSNNI